MTNGRAAPTSTTTVRAIVCIGSSAGGLTSLITILRLLPSGFPWPILITQHFPADVQSHLPEILARTCSLPIREAIEAERLAPGIVLTCPSSAEMGVEPDRTIMFRPRRRGPPGSIDYLFTTASVAAGPAMVAIVLSGMGHDGALGTIAVKKSKGTVIAEHPKTAEFANMPAAAIKAGTVDEALPSDQIPRFLIRLANTVEGG